MNEYPGSRPFDPKPVKGSSAWRWVVAGIVLAGLAAAAFLIPLPLYYAEGPGPVKDVESRVKITGAQTFSSEGNLYLTTVGIDDQVTFAELVRSIYDPNYKLISKEEFTGGQSYEEIIQQNRDAMTESKRAAIELALTALSLGHAEGDGARVVEALADSPADGVLREDDVIVGIDGQEVASACDVGRLVDLHEPGDDIDLMVERIGETESLTLTTAAHPDDATQAFLGILMEDVGYEFVSDVNVTIDTDNIGGPSAGLMFTLALYDKLTPDDLTGGLQIAGTGTIACDGEVGPIGGIDLKVAGAEAEGADIFLAPTADYEAARAAAGDGIEVVSIATFADALEYLENRE